MMRRPTISDLTATPFPTLTLFRSYGGRFPQRRTGNVLAALRTLGEEELRPADVIRSLCDAYLWLRRTEHALQMADEQQTQRVPARAEARIELARDRKSTRLNSSH